MPNRLLDRLAGDYQTLSDQYDAILERCDSENRDPTDDEVGLLDGLRGEMSPLGDRLVELRETDDRRLAAVRAMDGAPDLETRSANARPVITRIGDEPEVYKRDADAGAPRESFFRDLMHAQLDGDPNAGDRLRRHNQMQMRAAGTTTTGAGIIPPTWLFEEFAIIAHGARPWADTLRRVGITDANPVNIGVQVAPGAAVTQQASENTIPNDGSFNVNLLTTSPKTYTGKVDVSRQLLDGSNPAVDGIVYADCMGSYNEQIEQAVVAAFEAATGFAATITFPGTAPVYANLFDTFIDAAASVRKHRKAAPKVVFCSEGAWAFMAKEKDSQNRPLVTTGYHGPVNAYGLGEAVTYGQIAGEVVGLQVVASWAGVDNHLYVIKADDSLLLESSTFNFRYEEVLGPESIRLGVWGYAAPVIARYPAAIAKVDAGTTIPAPAMEDRELADIEKVREDEVEAAESGEGTGEGPGTPRRRR
jgi:HK97 family phage major capsid protein